MPTSLRNPGDILLVSCYELGHAPHGIALPLSFLRRAGFAPAVVDTSIEAVHDAALAAAKLIAISVPMHTALRLGARLIGRIRRLNPHCQLGLFGHYAHLNADYLLALGADWAMGGECEQALVDIAEGKAPPAPGDSVVLAKLGFAAIDRAGMPAVGHYAKLCTTAGDEVHAGYAETSRGCLDQCRHCPLPAVYRGRFFVVDKAVVIDDVAKQVAAGARHISFGDPDFLNGPGHAMAIARELHRRWPDVSFDVTTQVRHLLRNPDVLAELVELNCAFVVSAFESLNDHVLEKLAKRHRRADIVELTRRAAAAGLVLRPTFVPFTPWTAATDMRELVDFVVAQRLVANVAPIQLTIRLLVPPGSLLLEHDTGGVFGALDPPTLSHPWHHPDPRMDALQRDLARRVEQASKTDEPAADTFGALRALIYRAAELPVPAEPLPPSRPAPRMTEPWFC